MKKMTFHKNTTHRIAMALVAGNLFTATNVLADDAELRNKVDAMTTELNALKTEIQNLHNQTEAIATQQESTTTTDNNTASKTNGATLWGYGEVNYTRPKDDASQAQMDLRRAIFGIGYRFDDKTRFVSEYEIEHAIVSAGDEGELEVEQFYIDHQINKNLHLKAGLFLIPAGLINESHEPNNYYGVERNFVETAIIPTTWREGGAALFGSTETGLSWDVGVTTTVNLAGWDATSTEGQESPLGSIHQELQLAKANDLGVYGALNYRGLPGFVVGSSVFTSKIAHNDNTIKLAEDARMILWDIHSRWTPGKLDVSALYAEGTISDTKALNLTFAGAPTPVPKEFYGWYAQAAYKVWQSGNYALAPFVRYERFNTASAYEPMPLGLGVDSASLQTVATYGVSYNLHPQVVLKFDFQDFVDNSALNRYNLGLGLSF